MTEASARFGVSSQGGPSTPASQPDDIVDQPPLPVQHPVDRQVAGQRRHRPGQHEDQQQDLRPPALAHEEAREQQRQQQFQVHAEQQIEQRVHHRARIDRIGKQRAIARRIAAQPQPIADRVGHKGHEDRDVGGGKGQRPELVGAKSAAPPRPRRGVRGRGRAVDRRRDRHRSLLPWPRVLARGGICPIGEGDPVRRGLPRPIQSE